MRFEEHKTAILLIDSKTEYMEADKTMNTNEPSFGEIYSLKKLIKESKDILKLLEKRKQDITDCEKVLFSTIRDGFEQFDNTMTLIREAAALNRAVHPVDERVSLIFDTLLDRLDETHKNQIRVIEMLEDVSRSKDTIAAQSRDMAVSVEGAETVLRNIAEGTETVLRNIAEGAWKRFWKKKRRSE